MMPRFEVEEGGFGGGGFGRDRERDGGDGVLWKNGTGKLAKWQKKSAVAHWGIMRKVIPDMIWENW